MERYPVESNVVASMGYDNQARVLEVEFRSGRIYQYFDVPRRAVERMLAAQSLGAHFSRCVRDCYRYEAVNG